MSKFKYPEHYETFWSIYPRKIGKLGAFKKREAALKYAEPEEIIEGANKYSEKCKRYMTEMCYIAHPTTWLNQGRRDDE